MDTPTPRIVVELDARAANITLDGQGAIVWLDPVGHVRIDHAVLDRLVEELQHRPEEPVVITDWPCDEHLGLKPCIRRDCPVCKKAGAL